MNFHTLTPELQNYVLAILFMWCLGSSHVASHIDSRYFANSTASPLAIQCMVKASICLAVMPILSINHLFYTTMGWQFASLPIGLFLGWFVVRMEWMIVRSERYQKNFKVFEKMNKDPYYFSHTGPKHSILSLAPTFHFPPKTNLKKLHEYYAAHESQLGKFSLVIILATAVLEEIIFRGYLVQCCYFLPGFMINTALVVTVIVFGIAHASFGVGQMIAKTVLGACCMVAVLLCDTILPALIIHGYLNWIASGCQHD